MVDTATNKQPPQIQKMNERWREEGDRDEGGAVVPSIDWMNGYSSVAGNFYVAFKSQPKNTNPSNWTIEKMSTKKKPKNT